MTLGAKRSRTIGGYSKSLGLRDRVDQESLFEKEWDELVIRFDEERQSYRVDTASQNVDLDDDPHTAKLHD